MKVHVTSKKIYIDTYIKTVQLCRMSRYQINKIKIKLSMATSNYKLDTIYVLVDKDIINDKKNIIYTEDITFFHSISDINHIMQNTDITFQLSTYTITPIIYNYFILILIFSSLIRLHIIFCAN